MAYAQIIMEFPKSNLGEGRKKSQEKREKMFLGHLLSRAMASLTNIGKKGGSLE